jgi:hypothetical protein
MVLPVYDHPRCLLGASSTRPRALPSLLAVCRDFRHSALQEYALLAVFYQSIQKERCLYFHLTYHVLVCGLPTTTILKYNKARWRWLRSFPLLEELTLILWIPNGCHGRGESALRFPC